MRKKIERKMKESEPQLQGGEKPVRLTKGNGRGETQLPSSSRWGSVLWGGVGGCSAQVYWPECVSPSPSWGSQNLAVLVF